MGGWVDGCNPEIGRGLIRAQNISGSYMYHIHTSHNYTIIASTTRCLKMECLKKIIN